MHAGEWLTVVANTNCHTFEVAPVFTLVETEVLAKLACLVGTPYSDAHDGLFVPGGSIANLYGACRAIPDVALSSGFFQAAVFSLQPAAVKLAP